MIISYKCDLADGEFDIEITFVKGPIKNIFNFRKSQQQVATNFFNSLGKKDFYQNYVYDDITIKIVYLHNTDQIIIANIEDDINIVEISMSYNKYSTIFNQIAHIINKKSF